MSAPNCRALVSSTSSAIFFESFPRKSFRSSGAPSTGFDLKSQPMAASGAPINISFGLSMSARLSPWRRTHGFLKSDTRRELPANRTAKRLRSRPWSKEPAPNTLSHVMYVLNTRSKLGPSPTIVKAETANFIRKGPEVLVECQASQVCECSEIRKIPGQIVGVKVERVQICQFS